MYDSVAVLKSDPIAQYDGYGNETFFYTNKEIYVNPRSVYQAEFYNAAQAGLHPTIAFDMANREDYQGERLIEFDGTMYNIIRTDWTAQKDKISLICEERVQNG